MLRIFSKSLFFCLFLSSIAIAGREHHGGSLTSIGFKRQQEKQDVLKKNFFEQLPIQVLRKVMTFTSAPQDFCNLMLVHASLKKTLLSLQTCCPQVLLSEVCSRATFPEGKFWFHENVYQSPDRTKLLLHILNCFYANPLFKAFCQANPFILQMSREDYRLLKDHQSLRGLQKLKALNVPLMTEELSLLKSDLVSQVKRFSCIFTDLCFSAEDLFQNSGQNLSIAGFWAMRSHEAINIDWFLALIEKYGIQIRLLLYQNFCKLKYAPETASLSQLLEKKRVIELESDYECLKNLGLDFKDICFFTLFIGRRFSDALFLETLLLIQKKMPNLMRLDLRQFFYQEDEFLMHSLAEMQLHFPHLKELILPVFEESCESIALFCNVFPQTIQHISLFSACSMRQAGFLADWFYDLRSLVLSPIFEENEPLSLVSYLRCFSKHTNLNRVNLIFSDKLLMPLDPNLMEEEETPQDLHPVFPCVTELTLNHVRPFCGGLDIKLLQDMILLFNPQFLKKIYIYEHDYHDITAVLSGLQERTLPHVQVFWEIESPFSAAQMAQDLKKYPDILDRLLIQGLRAKDFFRESNSADH